MDLVKNFVACASLLPGSRLFAQKDVVGTVRGGTSDHPINILSVINLIRRSKEGRQPWTIRTRTSDWAKLANVSHARFCHLNW